MSNNVTVIFPVLDKTLEVEEGTKISEACAIIGEPQNLVCGGKGKCKKCTVDIKVDGKIETVISCQVPVSDGMEILITGDEAEAQILTSSILKDINPNPSLKLYHLNREQLNTPMGENDWETISAALNINLLEPSLDIMRKLSMIYHNPNGIDLIIHDKTVLDVTPAEIDNTIYGVAYDIGSTSVVGFLYNLKTYEQIGISSRLNKQTSVAGDVISRIEHTMSNKGGLDRLHNLLIETVNEIIDNLCKENDVKRNKIYETCFCGNSTMQHLFFKLHPERLGLSPFTSITHSEISVRAKDLKLKINPNGVAVFLPLLGGFVGADTSAVLLSVQNDDKNRLVIDLGTNGEIAVGKNYSFKVSSTACGPALEGAGLTHGMRGTNGAIERIAISSGDVYYKVIGDTEPQGICGSGIIDIVSELLRTDLINRRGGFAKPEDVSESNLAKRLTMYNDQKAFIVAYGEETKSGEHIVITQKDIRQVQLAKAAIFTGCNMLITESGLKGEELEEILIAGAFGNYINIDKAQYIGMIPYFKDVPVYSIGNAAATGSQMYLLSKKDRDECTKLADQAIHVEIATNPEFVTNFMKNTYMDKVERY